ncbi:methyltransferase family protein [Promicromonospora aerolata]|uniref:Methyltransferase family protein n=1 Tax=Promicromonospora aerolata TaxID=195749 RepID=A0ABW4VDG1_9MICO
MTGPLDPATAAVVVRAVAVGVPLLAVVALGAWRPPSARVTGAAVTATAWAALLLLPLNVVAPSLGWWTFHATGAVWLGVPVDLWLGWSLLWGAVPALSASHLRDGRGSLVLLAAVLVWLDLAVMPLGEPVVVLGGAWLVGEAVGVVTVLVPALFLTRWTLRGTHVTHRAWAQAFWAGGLLLALPVLALSPEPRWPAGITSVGLQLTLLTCLPGLAAMRELAAVGRGTPLPYDPPSHLVTSGPYAYLRNPMQTTVAATYAMLALTLGEPALLLGTLVAVGYSAGLGEWHEGEQLRSTFGAPYLGYRAAVRPWLPRWRPAPTVPAATLWVAADCDPCSGLARWFVRHEPVRLQIRPAAEHPDVLYRVTYEVPDDTTGVPGTPAVRAQGVAAVARALGHLHLGWALVGWALDLPVVRHFAQLGADAFGAGPRASRPQDCPVPALSPALGGPPRDDTRATDGNSL